MLILTRSPCFLIVLCFRSNLIVIHLFMSSESACACTCGFVNRFLWMVLGRLFFSLRSSILFLNTKYPSSLCSLALDHFNRAKLSRKRWMCSWLIKRASIRTILIIYGSKLIEVCLRVPSVRRRSMSISARSGIRSKESQRQFEAILKMPGLFKRETTSTTLISAALIKLATLFQEGYRKILLGQRRRNDTTSSIIIHYEWVRLRIDS